jgi:hypothetical protein
MWILQTPETVITDDLELIAATLLDRTIMPMTPERVRLLAAACLGVDVEEVLIEEL